MVAAAAVGAVLDALGEVLPLVSSSLGRSMPKRRTAEDGEELFCGGGRINGSWEKEFTAMKSRLGSDFPIYKKTKGSILTPFYCNNFRVLI